MYNVLHLFNYMYVHVNVPVPVCTNYQVYKHVSKVAFHFSLKHVIILDDNPFHPKTKTYL